MFGFSRLSQCSAPSHDWWWSWAWVSVSACSSCVNYWSYYPGQHKPIYVKCAVFFNNMSLKKVFFFLITDLMNTHVRFPYFKGVSGGSGRPGRSWSHTKCKRQLLHSMSCTEPPHWRGDACARKRHVRLCPQHVGSCRSLRTFRNNM